MKKMITCFMAAIFLFHLSAQTERRIVFLHTNDLHSRLTGFAPESSYSPLCINNDNTSGGFARIAAIFKNEKERNEAITIIMDSGDFLMGTLFHNLEKTTGFQLPLMKNMGYDVVCIGNHEFDFGPEVLAATIKTSMAKGPVPVLLMSNAVFDDKDPGDDSLYELLASNSIRRKIILIREGIRFGVFSLMGKDAAEVAPLSRPVNFNKSISAAKKMVKELRADKCEIIICLSHSGLSYSDKRGWNGEDARLARKVKGIDLIVSGHTHSMLEKPLVVNGVPIVQTGEYGRNVGRLEMIWTGKDLLLDNYRLIPVNDEIKGDSVTNLLIEEQKNKVNLRILSPLGFDYETPVVETDFLLECDEYGDLKSSNLGPLVADAIHHYVNKHSKEGTDISMVAAGIIRDKITPGIQTAPDIFRVMSLGSGKDNVPGYPLSRLYVSGKELKSILEILQIAYKSSPSNFCYYSGLNVEYNPSGWLFNKIKRIKIINPDGTGSEVDFSGKNNKLYSITANSYMLEFIGIIRKMSFGLINVVPKDASGRPLTDMKNSVIDLDEKKPGIQEGKEWLALMEYLSSMKDTNLNRIPDICRKYSVPVRTFIDTGR